MARSATLRSRYRSRPLAIGTPSHEVVTQAVGLMVQRKCRTSSWEGRWAMLNSGVVLPETDGNREP